MKKFFILSAALMISLAALAQPNQNSEQKARLTPEQRAQRAAENMANQLMLSDADAAKFIPVYKTYKEEMRAIHEKYRHAKRSMDQGPMNDKEVDALIRNGFAKSKAILNLREQYYEKFLKLLTPKQVKKIYDVEKAQAEKAAQRKWQRQNGHGAQHPGGGHAKHPQGQARING